jgi:hypothetical protein
MEAQATATQVSVLNTIPVETKVAIVVPLYGYFADARVVQFDAESLKEFMDRIRTSQIKSYVILVAESDRLPKEVKQYLNVHFASANVKGVTAENGATYLEYLEEGIDSALNDTDAQFIVVANPWIRLREGVLDNLCQELNGQRADVICGFDLRTYNYGGQVGIPYEQFDSFQFNPARVEWNFEWNLWGCRKQVAQQLDIDIDYKTHYFVNREFWQRLSGPSRGFVVASDQNYPFYSFNVDWTLIETKEEFEADKARFLTKWGFTPEISYN